MAKEKIIEIKPPAIKHMEITIVGDSDLVLNKMNDVNARQLSEKQKGKAKDTEKPNVWEGIITSIHWYNGKPTEYTKEALEKALGENKPCITAFGVKESLKDSVYRNNIRKNKTTFDATVNVIAKGGLIPIDFAEHYIDEKLMPIPGARGSRCLVYLNRFCGWKAKFTISFLETDFSEAEILNAINLAGFGIGIGSGRTSGYGRYHVESIR